MVERAGDLREMQLPDLRQVVVLLPLQSLLTTNTQEAPAEMRPIIQGEIRPEVMRNSLLGKTRVQLGISDF